MQTRLLAAALLLGAATLSGCNIGWYPEGAGVSDDRYTYYSTALQPTTVVLMDTRSDQVIYKWDIPVDQQLVLQFHKDRGDRTSVAPDMCHWDLWKIGTTSGTPSYHFACPPGNARRVDMITRAAELPYDMRPNESPIPMTGKPVIEGSPDAGGG